MFQHLINGDKIQVIVEQTEKQIAEVHRQIDKKVDENQFRVLQSFQNHRVSDTHFIPSTGYGYDDIGRETLEKIYAEVFGAEKGLVRPLGKIIFLVNGSNVAKSKFSSNESALDIRLNKVDLPAFV